MTFYIKVKDNRLEDVKFKTFGCGAAIAVSSMVSEMAMGKTLEEAMKITPRSVADELEGLPKQKFHCSNLGAQALRKAIEDYRSRKKKGEGVKVMAEPKERKEHPVVCPYCDSEMATEDLPLCQVCGVGVFLCPGCHKPVPRGEPVCPECGTEVKG